MLKESEERYKNLIDENKAHIAKLEQSQSTAKSGSMAQLESLLKERNEQLEEVQKKL